MQNGDFSASDFFSDVRRAFDDELIHAANDFQTELENIARSKGLSESVTRRIPSYCQKFAHLLRKHGKQNMDKFELYSTINIFPTTDQTVDLEISETDSSTLDNSKLASLRARYAELVATNNKLRSDCVAAEESLNDMSAALFNLHMGAQALDLHEVRPVIDTVSHLMQQNDLLRTLADKANVFTEDIMEVVGDEKDSAETTASTMSADGKRQRTHMGSVGSSVQTSSSDDLKRLNASLRSRGSS